MPHARLVGVPAPESDLGTLPSVWVHCRVTGSPAEVVAFTDTPRGRWLFLDPGGWTPEHAIRYER